MAVYFKITGYDGKPLDPIRNISICWGFLKSSGGLSSRIPPHLRYLDRSRLGLSIYLQQHFIDNQYRHFKGTKGLYNQVLRHIPQWFKDFKLVPSKGKEPSHLWIPLDVSSLRNYNALRMVRNLACLYITNTKLKPLEALLCSELSGAKGYLLMSIADSINIPFNLCSNWVDALQMLDRGPMLDNNDQPLCDMDLNIEGLPRIKPMNRAFATVDTLDAHYSDHTLGGLYRYNYNIKEWGFDDWVYNTFEEAEEEGGLYPKTGYHVADLLREIRGGKK